MNSEQVKAHILKQLRSMNRCEMKRFRVAVETELADRAFGEYLPIVAARLDEAEVTHGMG